MLRRSTGRRCRRGTGTRPAGGVRPHAIARKEGQVGLCLFGAHLRGPLQGHAGLDEIDPAVPVALLGEGRRRHQDGREAGRDEHSGPHGVLTSGSDPAPTPPPCNACAEATTAQPAPHQRFEAWAWLGSVLASASSVLQGCQCDPTDSPRCVEMSKRVVWPGMPPAGTGDRRLLDWLLLYPSVFALWPPLSFYAHNIDHFRLDALWLPLLVSLGAAAVLQGLVLATVRQPSLAAFKTFGFLCLLFAGGRVCLALRGTPLPGTSMDVGVLVAVATLLLALLALAARPPRGFDRLPAALALFCVALVAQPAWTIVAVELARARFTLHRTAGIGPARAMATLPHIFYLVLDGYAREDVLRDMYGHDNRPFLDALRSRGCYVASSAVANYPQTALSLASSLNLDYLDEWVAGLPPGSSDRHVLSEAIGRSRLVEALRASGYTFVAFSSGYGVAEARSADRFESLADSEAPRAFWRGFLASTPVPDLVSLPALVSAGEELHRRGVLYTFDRLGPLAKSPGPLFVLAHVIAPHPPFVFDARDDCRPAPGPPSPSPTAKPGGPTTGRSRRTIAGPTSPSSSS